MALVLDKAVEGTTPSIADIFSSVNTYSFPVSETAWRFQILSDRVFDLNASAEAGTIKSFEFQTNLNCLETFGASSAGTVADIQSGALWLVVIGTSAAGASAGTVTFNTLVEFRDD